LSLQAIWRSLSTAWTPEPHGPAWAPWAWTALLDTLVAVLLTLLLPRTGSLAENFVVSQAIGLGIHALFRVLGRWLQLDMFDLPLPLRAAYVASVTMAGSWIGYAAARWALLGDLQRLTDHMTHAARFLLVIPPAWALVTVVLFASVSRLRSRQLARERERTARVLAEREAIAARLALLNAQVEPHFLYNSLANVSATIDADPAAARRLIDALIAYLRASARNMARPLVPLAEEMEGVRGYLEVMHTRLGGRLRWSCVVPERAAVVPVPPAAVQTLVENAIKHGIEPSARGGEVAVTVREAAAGGWAVEVADTGAGPAGEPGTGAASGSGTGLANLSERLRLALGPSARVTLQARAGGGALAHLELPAAPAGAGGWAEDRP
jgi:signal transduction histidine kinase